MLRFVGRIIIKFQQYKKYEKIVRQEYYNEKLVKYQITQKAQQNFSIMKSLQQLKTKTSPMAKCYMCNNESTSREHTPPQGFFPAGQRMNLITVPSCSTHNEDTSSDDEYVRNIITASIGNNQTSIDHFFDKSYRSFKRHPELANPIIKSLRDVNFFKQDAKAFQLDRPRFDRVIRKIAYALFYKEFGETWERLLAVTTNQIKMTDMSNDHLGEMFETLTEGLDTLIMKGENSLVFQYSFLQFNNDKFDKALFMIFYEGFPFWIIPDRESNHSDFDLLLPTTKRSWGTQCQT